MLITSIDFCSASDNPESSIVFPHVWGFFVLFAASLIKLNCLCQVTLNSTADIASYSIQLDEHSALNTYEVSTEGSGAVAVAVLLTTNFKLPYPNPLYQGIFVERAIHSLQSTEPVGVIPLGSMVKIVLQLTAAADLPGTTIQVSMPGGLEVMHITGKGQKTFKPCAGRVLDLDELACANQVNIGRSENLVQSNSCCSSNVSLLLGHILAQASCKARA